MIGAFLKMVPMWAWGALAAVLAVVGAYGLGDARGRAAVQHDWDVQTAIEAQSARDANAVHVKQVADQNLVIERMKDEQSIHVAAVASAASAAAASSAELDRLRYRLAHPPAAVQPVASAASAASGPDGPATTSDILGRCAGEVQRVASVVDSLSVQVSGLQARLTSTIEACNAGR